MIAPGSEYTRSGVDISAADKAKQIMKQLVEGTYNASVVGSHGGFGGLYSLKELTNTDIALVGSADGVGTKLKLAFMTNIHNTVGRDLVNHLVNDILCVGARPLFFFDYLGLGRLEPETVTEIVTGLANGCKENNAVLLGGETAEMPGFYAEGEYDMAGFIVGWVNRGKIIDGSRIEPGDKIVGLASNGLHTNGFSLARRAFFEIAGFKPGDSIAETGSEVCQELLKIHRSYLRIVEPMLDASIIHGLAHITGGGFEGNISRIVPVGVTAKIEASSWPVPGVFRAIARIASVTNVEMYRVFNMGIGMVVFCEPGRVPEVLGFAAKHDTPAYVIGHCVAGDERVEVRY